MTSFTLNELKSQPGHLKRYFGNGGASITNESGKQVAYIPPAIEPIVEDDEDLVLTETDWLD